MEELIKKLRYADSVLEADGYKDWCYVRLAISEAIKALQPKPIYFCQCGSLSRIPDYNNNCKKCGNRCP